MTVSYELLRTLLVVGTSDSFAHAAARRGITPPAISQQIGSLEAQLGVRLFERIGGRAKLTAVGGDLVAVLQQHFAPIEDAIAAVIEDHRTVRGVVRIGGPRAFGAMWLRPRLIRLLKAHPELRVDIRLDVPSVLRRRLLEGELDFALLVSDADHASLESTVVHVEEFLAVASPLYLKKHGTPTSADEYRSHSFIVFDESLAMLAPWWRATFGPTSKLPEGFVCQVTSMDEMASLVEAGLGIAVLPGYFVEAALAGGTLVVLPRAARKGRAHAPARNPIQLAWRKGTIETARFLTTRAALLEKS